MGFFSKLFGGNSSSTPPQRTPQVVGYEPPAINQRFVLEELDVIAQNAVSDYYHEKNKDMKWIEESEEERYRYYRSKPVEQIKALAESGDAKAQYVIADSLADQNKMKEANYWFKLSAESGVPDSEFCYGLFLLKGFAGEKNPDLGLEYLRKAAYDGLCYEAAEEMAQWLDAQMDEPNGYKYIDEGIHWLSVLAYGAQGTEDEWIYALKTERLCDIAIAVNFETLWSMNVEHMKFEGSKSLGLYHDLERLTLMAYHFERIAFKTGKAPEGEAEIMGEVLCRLGEVAQEMQRAYAVKALRVAAEMGNDYAASVVARQLIFDAVEGGASLEEREKSIFFRNLLKQAERAAARQEIDRERAHALMGLSHFYDFGAGVPRNITTAYSILQQSANMNYGLASQMLKNFERMPNGEYRHKKF